MSLKKDLDQIIHEAIQANLPDASVREALSHLPKQSGRHILVAFGKAAWQMANAAYQCLPTLWDAGIVITKEGHARGSIGSFSIYEAGHPIVDARSVHATEEALALVRHLSPDDQVVVLISGGGSALFEKPLLPLSELESINRQLLASGANIIQINTLRKRLSAVKGGRFAQACAPAQVYTMVLSDILGDPLDMIASGPTVPDSSRSSEALDLVERFNLDLSDTAMRLLREETPKSLPNATTTVSGSVRYLVAAAQKACDALGYTTHVITTDLACEAREAGRFIGAIARTQAKAVVFFLETDRSFDDPIADSSSYKVAYLFGGETVVHVTGNGKGGRNQEIALAAAPLIAGLDHVLIASVGSDGTDGPTDAAGAWVDGRSEEVLEEAGYDVDAVLSENNAYEALSRIHRLIRTGPTGTNVNDLTLLLMQSPSKGFLG